MMISDLDVNTWEGDSNPRVWSDVDDCGEIFDFPRSKKHRAMDRKIIDAATELVRPLIVTPPDIYGESLGGGTHRTILIPEYAKAVKRAGKAFYCGKGENIKSVVHITDVASLFLLLVQQGLDDGGKADWGGKEAFYFATSGEVRWKDVATAVAGLGRQKGFLESDAEPTSLQQEEMMALYPARPMGPLTLWAANQRAKSDRARRLGWKPKGPSLWECLQEDVELALERE